MYQIIINETDLQDKEGFESFLNKNLHSGKPVFHVGKFFSIFKSSDTTNGCYALSYKDSTTHGIRCFAPDVSINLLPSGQPSIKRDNMWEINTMSHYNSFSIFDIKRSASLILIFFAVILFVVSISQYAAAAGTSSEAIAESVFASIYLKSHSSPILLKAIAAAFLYGVFVDIITYGMNLYHKRKIGIALKNNNPYQLSSSLHSIIYIKNWLGTLSIVTDIICVILMLFFFK